MGERKCTARSSSLSVAQSLKKQAAAQHGGGYSYRLCRNAEGAVTEDCFQRTHLAFAEKDVQWLQHINGTKYQIPMTKFTHPVTGAEWARIPFPTCSGGGNPAGHGFTDGQAGPGGVYYCPTGTEYPEPLLNGQRVGLVGFGYCNNTAPTAAARAGAGAGAEPEGAQQLTRRWDAVSGCNATGRWLNRANGIYVDITQTSETSFSASTEGPVGWKGAIGNLTAPDTAHPQGSLALSIPNDRVYTGIFGTSTVANAPACTEIIFSAEDKWCREPFCSTAPPPSPPHRSCTGDAYHSYSIVDRVVIPEDLEPGDYLLSWRWVRIYLCLSLARAAWR